MQRSLSHVLVTGNLGYIGAVLTPLLAKAGYTVTGLDAGFFPDSFALYQTESGVTRQIFKDIRDIEVSDFEGVDAIVHLAGLSNDPLGEINPEITYEINHAATLRLAECAKAAGAARFVYASSQSMYGVADTSRELPEDDSPKNPVTAYAKAKWMAEQDLLALNSPQFAVSFFRPSTVFGQSPKLRCDIVYNNLVACAYTTGRIEILSDGSPIRPVIHVLDVCQAFMSGLTAPLELVMGQAFNIGLPGGNFTVRELAEAAQKAVPGSELAILNTHGADCRTYRVSFDKILTRLKDHYTPSWDLAAGGEELTSMFKRTGFSEQDFRGERCTRLARLKNLLAQGVLDEKMRFVREA